MPKFKQIPVIIDAVLWTGTNVDEITDFMFACGDARRVNCIGPNGGIILGGALLLGERIVLPGDWIIKEEGEFYPCKPEIFEVKYTVV